MSTRYYHARAAGQRVDDEYLKRNPARRIWARPILPGECSEPRATHMLVMLAAPGQMVKIPFRTVLPFPADPPESLCLDFAETVTPQPLPVVYL